MPIRLHWDCCNLIQHVDKCKPLNKIRRAKGGTFGEKIETALADKDDYSVAVGSFLYIFIRSGFGFTSILMKLESVSTPLLATNFTI